ncbi:hypothetical protein ACTXO1_06465 [Corynebacterium casei]|uniref:hypothetical protein n=1 Tax=Corynebacterium casei TaxID=160386 RepID=UPI003FD30320
MTTMLQQLQRRHEAELRLVPLPATPDHRVHRPLKVKANPHKTLTMLSMGVPFAFSIEDLRAAWQIASPTLQEHIEHIVTIQKQKENAA